MKIFLGFSFPTFYKFQNSTETNGKDLEFMIARVYFKKSIGKKNKIYLLVILSHSVLKQNLTSISLIVYSFKIDIFYKTL